MTGCHGQRKFGTSLLALLLALLVYAYQIGYWFNFQDLHDPYVETNLTWVEIEADIHRRNAIVQSFKHAWTAYERHAMGCDEYRPISQQCLNLTEVGGIGYTIIDAIDTMHLMGLESEYNRARDWISHELTFDRDGNFSTFETTIRILGGLLSVYNLTSDPIFLSKAIDLADRILPAFDTPSGLPFSMINLGKSEGVDDPSISGLAITAEVTTLQLEFKYLTYLTGNSEYWDKAEKAIGVVKRALKNSSMAPVFISLQNGRFIPSDVRLGSRGDSFYEYLLKQYLQTNKTESMYLDMYSKSMSAIRENLLQNGPKQGLLFTAEYLPYRQSDGKISWTVSRKQDHLACFLPGSLMLGATTTGIHGKHVSRPPVSAELTKTARLDWTIGKDLLKTCVDTCKTETGLPPEIIHYYKSDDSDTDVKKERDWYIKDNENRSSPSFDAQYILRPETIESLFLAYRLTGDETYREQGWEIFQSIEKHCRVEGGGYSGILNVDDMDTEKVDKMETFFFSETLKYLYLLFSDDTILPLNEYVFNTEAHPLPIFTPNGDERRQNLYHGLNAYSL